MKLNILLSLAALQHDLQQNIQCVPTRRVKTVRNESLFIQDFLLRLKPISFR